MRDFKWTQQKFDKMILDTVPTHKSHIFEKSKKVTILVMCD